MLFSSNPPDGAQPAIRLTAHLLVIMRIRFVQKQFEFAFELRPDFALDGRDLPRVFRVARDQQHSAKMRQTEAVRGEEGFAQAFFADHLAQDLKIALFGIAADDAGRAGLGRSERIGQRGIGAAAQPSEIILIDLP